MGCDSGPWLGVRLMQVSAFSRVRIDRFHCTTQMHMYTHPHIHTQSHTLVHTHAKPAVPSIPHFPDHQYVTSSWHWSLSWYGCSRLPPGRPQHTTVSWYGDYHRARDLRTPWVYHLWLSTGQRVSKMYYSMYMYCLFMFCDLSQAFLPCVHMHSGVMCLVTSVCVCTYMYVNKNQKI